MLPNLSRIEIAKQSSILKQPDSLRREFDGGDPVVVHTPIHVHERGAINKGAIPHGMVLLMDDQGIGVSL